MLVALTSVASSAAFAPSRRDFKPLDKRVIIPRLVMAPSSPLSTRGATSTTTNLRLFDKVFEESGPLGKGITVGKVSVSIAASGPERTSRDSIFALLEEQSRATRPLSSHNDSCISRSCHQTCMALLRKSDDWLSACSESEWFRADDYGKAERWYNKWADGEGSKFERESVQSLKRWGPMDVFRPKVVGNPTVAVISLVVEIQGDETNFDRAGYSIDDTKAVLASIASNCRVEGGGCLNAFEVFWTPSEPAETLAEGDMIVDFPELVKL